MKIIDEVEEVLHTCGNEKLQPLQLGNLNQTQLEEPLAFNNNETQPLGIANITQAFPMSDASMAFETHVFGQASGAADFFQLLKKEQQRKSRVLSGRLQQSFGVFKMLSLLIDPLEFL